MAVPFPSLGPTTPTILDLRQARFGPHWHPLPQTLVLTVGEGDHTPSGGGDKAGAPQDGPSAPVTVSALDGDSDMEISDDDRPPPSSVSSCLQTHPQPHQEAHDFLSSLLLAPDGEGVWHRDGTVDDEGAGVCPGARPVDTAGGALVETIPDVDLFHDASVSLHGHALGPAAHVEDPAAAQSLLELSVLPLGVNAGRVAPIVVGWKNGMLRRRPLSSDNPGPLLDSSYAYSYGLMALPHRWQNRHLRVPLNSVFPGGLSRPRD
jgi:hypothetical protein